jgi:hypothetical protein
MCTHHRCAHVTGGRPRRRTLASAAPIPALHHSRLQSADRPTPDQERTHLMNKKEGRAPHEDSANKRQQKGFSMLTDPRSQGKQSVETRDIARAVSAANMATDAEAIANRHIYELSFASRWPMPRKNGEPVIGWRIIEPENEERRLGPIDQAAFQRTASGGKEIYANRARKRSRARPPMPGRTSCSTTPQPS